ncbi:flagellar basal body-associated FliL family protein [Anatilimnocola floriformis]|uniref:flagellar basal body-associated FliL family protein n=1 Tax=Anatilimnocola floriformis TaxID=2948575 RepID=UPI0020C505A3|nr:flagellar basal body-associated FliL family protein [Anatilimnocola floriformis]
MRTYLFTLFAFGLAVVGLAGCGAAPVQVAGMDVPELLELLEDEQMKKNPHAYTEVDLGQFKVTRMLPADEGQLVVRFHLIGVVPEAKQEEFTGTMPKYETRLRDSILALVQKAEPEHLSDPALSYLKAEMMATINEQMHTRLLRSVVFSDLSIQRK